MTDRQALLQNIDSYLDAAPRTACDVERLGPFTLFFRRDSAMLELSYARPAVPLPTLEAEDIDQIRAAFAKRGRTCRWEFLADLVPQFPELLVQHGFPPPIPRPLMVVTKETFRPERSVIADIRPIRREETRAVGRVLFEAFGAPIDADYESEPDMLASILERGASVYAAFVDGKPVAAGSHAPVGETTEVAGVGTLADFRGRGLAGALTSALVEDAFGRGCACVFLSAADETVQRVYARVGFAKIGVAMDTADSVGA